LRAIARSAKTARCVPKHSKPRKTVVVAHINVWHANIKRTEIDLPHREINPLCMHFFLSRRLESSRKWLLNGQLEDACRYDNFYRSAERDDGADIA
jgi:hypothetical protein